MILINYRTFILAKKDYSSKNSSILYILGAVVGVDIGEKMLSKKGRYRTIFFLR